MAEQTYWGLLPAFEAFEFSRPPIREQPPEYVQALREGVRPERAPGVARLLVIEEEGD
jgi:hypothetical protein